MVEVAGLALKLESAQMEAGLQRTEKAFSDLSKVISVATRDLDRLNRISRSITLPKLAIGKDIAKDVPKIRALSKEISKLQTVTRRVDTTGISRLIAATDILSGKSAGISNTRNNVLSLKGTLKGLVPAGLVKSVSNLASAIRRLGLAAETSGVSLRTLRVMMAGIDARGLSAGVQSLNDNLVVTRSVARGASSDLSRLKKMSGGGFGGDEDVDGVNRKSGALNRLNRAANNTHSSISRLSSGFLNFNTVISAVSVLGLSRSFINLGDAITFVDSRIKLVTKTSAEYDAVLAELSRISKNTGSELQSNAQLFTRVTTATERYGLSLRDNLDFLDTFNKLAVISGSRSATVAKASIQLGQALGFGKFRGDEFNSVIEAMPQILDLIADRLNKVGDDGITMAEKMAKTNKTVKEFLKQNGKIQAGQVKELSTKGLIGAALVFDAITQASKDVDKQFANVELSISRSIENLNTEFINFGKAVNDNFGVTQKVSKAIKGLADNLDIAAAALAGPAVAAIVLATKATIGFTLAILANPLGALAVAISAAAVAFTEFRDEASGVSLVLDDGSEAALTWEEVLGAAIDNTTNKFSNFFTNVGDEASDLWGDLTAGFSDVTDFLNESVNEITGFFTEMFGESLSEVVDFFEDLWKDIKKIMAPFTPFFTGLADGIVKAFNSITAPIKSIFDGITDIAETTTRGLQVIFGGLEGATLKEGLASQKLIDTKNAEAFAAKTFARLEKDTGIDISALPDSPAALGAKSSAKKTGEIALKSNTPDNRGSGRKKVTFSEAVQRTLLRENELLKQNIFTRQQLQAILQIQDTTGTKLNKTQEEYVRSLVLSNQEQEFYNELVNFGGVNIDEAESKTKAMAKAQEDGRITIERYNFELRELTKAANSFDNSQTITGLVEENRALATAIEKRQEFQTALALEKELRAELRGNQEEELQNILKQNEALKAADAVVQEIRGPQEELRLQQLGLNRAFEMGAINSKEFVNAVRELNLQQLELKVAQGEGSFADGFLLEFERLQEGIFNFASESGQALSGFLIEFGSQFAETIGEAIFSSDDLGESLKAVGRDAVSSLISSLIKLGAQFVINQALNAALGTSATALAAGQAATLSAAWAPAAAGASLATAGTNAGPAIGALTAATSAATSLLAFRDGGLVQGPGTGTSDSLLARLSAGEFVVNARATKQNLPLLSAINNGNTSNNNNQRQSPNIVMNVTTENADSFGENQAQVLSRMRTAMDRQERFA